MAYQDMVIFQRTDLGRAEIRDKRHGLTQSERLVLIIVDGVSSYGQLRVKLKSLVKERFDRALRSLSDKGLLYEVMFPLDNQVPDFVEADAMDRFLRQEDSDPVSVIAYQPEEELSNSILRADGLIANSDVQEVISVDPYPSLIMNTIDRLEEPVIYTKDKVVKSINIHEPVAETIEVDFYLPLEIQEEVPVIVAPIFASTDTLAEPKVSSVAPVKARSRPESISSVKLEAVASPLNEAKAASKANVKPTVRDDGNPITQVVVPQSDAKTRTKLVQKFPEPKPPKLAPLKRKKTWVDYLDSRYSLLLLVLGMALAFMPALVRLFK
ncbi:hypothetical protein AAKU61_002889 [Undibacterium sp. GrIS 1.2]|uniref:hypothetical protein n=1 Tax=Undibacterium sp. GrIS 1.2 TaxID=3143933 RepID=UPI00339537EA